MIALMCLTTTCRRVGHHAPQEVPETDKNPAILPNTQRSPSQAPNHQAVACANRTLPDPEIPLLPNIVRATAHENIQSTGNASLETHNLSQKITH
jgi:hypothetical protein